jgi:hypothetical protein
MQAFTADRDILKPANSRFELARRQMMRKPAYKQALFFWV